MRGVSLSAKADCKERSCTVDSLELQTNANNLSSRQTPAHCWTSHDGILHSQRSQHSQHSFEVTSCGHPWPSVCADVSIGQGHHMRIVYNFRPLSIAHLNNFSDPAVTNLPQLASHHACLKCPQRP